MYGPKGIGALFIQRGVQNRIEPIIYGGGQQRHLRSGTVPVPLCVGMGVAAALLCSAAAQQERELLRARRDTLIRELIHLPWPIHLNGPEGQLRHPGNVNLRFDGFLAHDILNVLQPRVAASTGSACASGIPEPSHVLRAIGLSGAAAEASIRFGLGRGTTDQDIGDAVRFITDALAKLSRSPV